MMRAMLLGLAMTLPATTVLAETLPIGELRRGMMAVVEGNVERITDEDEFILADKTGDIRIYIGPNAMPVRPGDLVRVEGYVDDDVRMELYADAITLADGQIVTLPRRY